MDFSPFFFGMSGESPDVRRIDNLQRLQRRTERRRHASLVQRVDTLERNLGSLALILGAMLRQVNEKGVVSRAEVRSTMAELDEKDGVRDGWLAPDILRDLAL